MTYSTLVSFLYILSSNLTQFDFAFIQWFPGMDSIKYMDVWIRSFLINCLIPCLMPLCSTLSECFLPYIQVDQCFVREIWQTETTGTHMYMSFTTAKHLDIGKKTKEKKPLIFLNKNTLWGASSTQVYRQPLVTIKEGRDMQ